MKGQHIIIVSVGLSSVDAFFDRYINQSGIYQAWHQPLTLNKMSSYKFKQQFYHPPVSAVSVVASIIIITLADYPKEYIKILFVYRSMDSLDGQLNQKHHTVCLFKLGHAPYSYYYLHYLYAYHYNRKNSYIHATRRPILRIARSK